ncbi:hypothetical protein D6827_00065 [Candidatus Parcubacteria bacterium]|nr:MAG: hypothetical protein D6827_00065 [Candidatus Parcubacteria bacterium]
MALTMFPRPDVRGNYRRVTKPAIEPITADELRNHLHLTVDNLDDADAYSLIATARAYCEEFLSIAFITQTWQAFFDAWPVGSHNEWWDGIREIAYTEVLKAAGNMVELLPYPLQSVDQVAIYTDLNTQKIYSSATTPSLADTFHVVKSATPPFITPVSTWPAYYPRPEAIQIDFTAGFGLAASDVPAPIRHGLLLFSSYLFTHRGDDCGLGNAFDLSGARSIMEIYKVPRL